MNKYLYLLCLVFLSACATAEGTNTPRDLYTNAQDSRATEAAAALQAQYQERFLTATAEAPIMHITETAAALVVYQTQVSLDKTATAVLWTPTVTSTPTPNMTATLGTAQLFAQQTVIVNNTIRDNLVIERQTYTNQFYKILPQISFTIVVLVLAIVLVWYSRRERYKPAAVDARGNVLPVIDVVDGTVTDVDRNPNYRGEMHESLFNQWLRRKLNLPRLLPVITSERQDATTQRDQLVDLATRGLPAPAGSAPTAAKRLAGQEMNKQLSGPNLESRFRLLENGEESLEVIDGEIIKVLDKDWKEAE